MSDTTEPRLYGGRYELHRRLARGGMADVYLARDTLLDRPVALKVLFAEFATDPTFVERFRREAQSAANLNHPNIVSVYDWGEEDGTYFIVMEYVDGRSLSQILRDEGPLQPDRAADITIDVASALAFAHRHGVVHRDVKPGNVLVSPLGQVKVADFGIARAVSSRENLTQTGTVMGTATYFSPEQARGEAVDPRSDVYSLGVVLYELLVGSPPFSGDSPVSVAYKHVSEAPVPVRERKPEVPEQLEAVCMRSLAKNPANRYHSADELAADLRRFRAGQPVLAEALLPEALTVAVPVADATRAVPAVAATRVNPAAAGAIVSEPRRRTPIFLVVLVLLLAALGGLIALLAINLNDNSDAGTKLVAVDSVLGFPQADAERRLTAAGFKPFAIVEANAAPPGTVFAQNPQAGAKVASGSTVDIHVSAPPAKVAAPDVVGKTKDAATSAIYAANLLPNISQEPSDTVPADTVIRQSPAGGTMLDPKSEIDLVVSAGKGQAVVPNLRGHPSATAANELGAAGFQVATQQAPANDVGAGDVISSNPPAGTVLDRGSTVTLIISTGPPSTTTTAPTSTTTTP
ncbi:MAG TPA: Stk1 family PASTA domain-containing Ser/Thr kinase [Acidimicrobiales bacterium]